METGFFSKPKTLDDWFRVPAALGVVVIGILAAVTILLALPGMVLFASTGGGFDLYVCVVLLVLFPLPAWRAWKAMSKGQMRKSCLWSLTPPVILWGLYLMLST